MQIRVYRCAWGHETEVFLPDGKYPPKHPCGFCDDAEARNVPAASRLSGYEGSARAQEHAIKAKGLVPWEKGMERDALRNREYRHEERVKRLEPIIDQVVRESADIRPD